MMWTHIKRIWDILKHKIGQFWGYLTGCNSSILRVAPARAVQLRPRARAPRTDPVKSPLDPNRFELD